MVWGSPPASPPSSPGPAPLDLPRDRRQLLRESVELAGEMLLESYIYASDPFRATTVAVYENIRDDLIKLLLKRLGGQWESISLFNVGRALDDSVPTIVVLVDKFVVHDWQQLNSLYKDVIKGVMLEEMELPIEFLPGDIGHANQDGTYKTRLHSVHPGLGASLGVVNGRRAGTMGGFVNLETDGRV